MTGCAGAVATSRQGSIVAARKIRNAFMFLLLGIEIVLVEIVLVEEPWLVAGERKLAAIEFLLMC